MSTPVTHTSSISIRFRDLDAYNHVNNAVYLTYVEVARMLFFKEKVGVWDWNDQGILLAKQEINYLIPLMLDDEAEITLTVSNVGTKSITIGFEIFKKYNGEMVKCTHGSTVLVCFNHKSQKTTPVPESWKKLLGVD